MTQIRVRQLNQRIVVEDGTNRVSIVTIGPQGLQGPQGPPGSGGNGIAFEFIQAVPSASWVINHNLGYYPNFNITEAESGLAIEAAPIHHSTVQLELQFNTARAGTARLS